MGYGRGEGRMEEIRLERKGERVGGMKKKMEGKRCHKERKEGKIEEKEKEGLGECYGI